MEKTVNTSDLLKISDALESASRFLTLRDEMNAGLHLAREVRYSPLTSEIIAAKERLQSILSEL